MNFSLAKTFAISIFILEYGTETVPLRAAWAFLIEVNISAIGSIYLNYHDDFLTPGIIPSLASFLKHIRHKSKSLIYPLFLQQRNLLLTPLDLCQIFLRKLANEG